MSHPRALDHVVCLAGRAADVISVATLSCHRREIYDYAVAGHLRFATRLRATPLTVNLNGRNKNRCSVAAAEFWSNQTNLNM